MIIFCIEVLSQNYCKSQSSHECALTLYIKGLHVLNVSELLIFNY